MKTTLMVESVWSRSNGKQCAAVATSRLHNIAGKDDPVALVRTQMDFPAAGEVLAPCSIGHYVAGGMRGSHNMPLMPVALNTLTSYFDGPPLVSCAAFCVPYDKLTEPVDAFAHPFWNEVRSQVSRKAIDMGRQSFNGAAMLPMGELEYTGVIDKLRKLETRFRNPAGKASSSQGSLIQAGGGAMLQQEKLTEASDLGRLCEGVSPMDDTCDATASCRCGVCGKWFCAFHAGDEAWHPCTVEPSDEGGE